MISERISQASASRPVVLLTGARQTGKSSLLRRLFPQAHYVTLDRVSIAAEAMENPSVFLDRFKGCAILDEIQYAPGLLRELKIRVDEDRQNYGRWILTGSQRIGLMDGVSESLAGRVAILQLESLSAEELRGFGKFGKKAIQDTVWKGGFPECWANPNVDVGLYFENYIQTYLERDLRTLVNISSLRDFQRFIQSCAIRVGQLLNMSDISKDVGVSVNTIKSWIGALEASGIIHLLPPYHANIGKRLAKSPKLYFADNGLLCHLLHVEGKQSYQKSLHMGNIWENLVMTEMVKTGRLGVGKKLFYYRDQNGVEIDFVVEGSSGLWLVEAKSSERVDSTKLNFRKVAPLFKDRNVRCSLMCSSQEDSVIHLRDYDIVNPQFHSVLEYFKERV